MTHQQNTRAFARRYARGFWGVGRRLLRGTLTDGIKVTEISSPAEPAPAGLASAGTTGAGELPNSANCGEKGGDNKPDTNQQRPYPPSTHSAGGGVCCCVPLLAQIHLDRWATLAVIAVFICAFAVEAYRANSK